jgi:hypothetical protein
MGQPIYTPTFHHNPWIDFVDSVQAGGGNGINIRFQGIEAEFTAIAAAFDNLLSRLTAPQTMTLAPAPISFPTDPWLQELGWIVTPNTGSPPNYTWAKKSFGWMPVYLPDGSIIQSLRVTGDSAGGDLLVYLCSQLSTGKNEVTLLQAHQTLSTVSSPAAFDLQVPTAPQKANIVVNNKLNKYFLYFMLSSGNTASDPLGNGGTSLYSFQIGYSVV